ncbi:GspH/FimT family pseudopilin [Marinobacter fonticola]|uniref:GspH/FimT family pseudopilin n=1 Tax=Marinobacter fonticola TaxID=2603215 RepID=UPI0011E7EF18|nr:GspH/FimT family pseudopilin [Marinobacter fonticola]
MSRYVNQRAFTLIELLTVLSLVAIASMLAMPAWSFLVERSERSTVTGGLISAFNLARTTAINARSTVTVCPLDDDQECVDDWSLPVTIFLDPDRSRSRSPEETVVRLLAPPKRGTLLVQSSSRPYFGFIPNGMASSAIGNIRWCPRDNNPRHAIQLRINRGGRVMTAQDRDGDDIVEGSDGNPISCS